MTQCSTEPTELADTALEASRTLVLLRRLRAGIVHSGASLPAHHQMADTSFVPELVMCVLVSQYGDETSLHGLLCTDWSRSWRGWSEGAHALGECDTDFEMSTVAHDVAQRFCRIALSNLPTTAKSDASRRLELSAHGKAIGKGLVHGNNECCADSLLQILSSRRIVPERLLRNVAERRRACAACRAFLVDHSDARLHPQRRTDNGEVADASDAEHDSAFLEHHIHSEPVVLFFLHYFHSEWPIEPEGLTVMAYTRWDSEVLPACETNAVTFGRHDDIESHLHLGPPYGLGALQ
jgi:hypothetical protein